MNAFTIRVSPALGDLSTEVRSRQPVNAIGATYWAGARDAAAIYSETGARPVVGPRAREPARNLQVAVSFRGGVELHAMLHEDLERRPALNRKGPRE
jgi:hypothetical protein